jgi:DNA primase
MAKLRAETLKAVIDPERFYRDSGLTLKGRANGDGWLLTRCPLHDDSNPSLSVNLKNGGFCCFSCGEKGDLIRFHSLLNRLSFRESMNDLARIYLR